MSRQHPRVRSIVPLLTALWSSYSDESPRCRSCYLVVMCLLSFVYAHWTLNFLRRRNQTRPLHREEAAPSNFSTLRYSSFRWSKDILSTCLKMTSKFLKAILQKCQFMLHCTPYIMGTILPRSPHLRVKAKVKGHTSIFTAFDP